MAKILIIILILQALILLSACGGATPNIPVKINDFTKASNNNIITKCLPAVKMEKFLFASYRETRKATALVNIKTEPPKKVLFVFYVSENGSWTATITGKEGISCIVLWGDTFSLESMEITNGIKI